MFDTVTAPLTFCVPGKFVTDTDDDPVPPVEPVDPVGPICTALEIVVAADCTADTTA
jgi:hypothetical protein